MSQATTARRGLLEQPRSLPRLPSAAASAAAPAAAAAPAVTAAVAAMPMDERRPSRESGSGG